MVTLKHICQQYRLDPYPLRQLLRKRLPHSKNQRWRWHEDDPILKQVHQIAKELSNA